MAYKVPSSERTSKLLFDALNGREEAEDLIGEIMRLGRRSFKST